MVRAMNIDCYYSSNSDEFYLVYIYTYIITLCHGGLTSCP